jgi:hypothetical protein
MVLSVIPRTVIPEALLTLSRAQGGVVSKEQATFYGISRTVIERLISEQWRPLWPGIYALTPDSFLQRAWAGVLIGGPAAVIGRESAGFLHGWLAEPDQICVFVPGNRKAHRPDDRWEFVRSVRRGSGEPSKTRLAQTLVDLAPVLGADDLAGAVMRALGNSRTSPQQIINLVEDLPTLPNRQRLLELVGGYAQGIHSPLEVRYARDVERAHGLPPGRRQVNVLNAYRTDVLYEPYPLIVELDGVAFHVNKLADMERDNWHLLEGLATLRFGWQAVARQPCQVATQVATALHVTGWPGPTHPCRRCPR